MKIKDFYSYRKPGRRISMVTAYDYTLASLAAASAVDALLVGDSLAMVMHGMENTLGATTEMMALHTAAVARAAAGKLVITDMPFLTFRKGVGRAMDAAEELMKAGAQALKLEGVDGHEDVIERLTGSGIPVMGHLGLTPQYVHGLGGYRVQGRDEAGAARIKEQARRLEELGCFALVLECVPAPLAREITAQLRVPVIGIGAGPHTDGQVLVLQDLLGLYDKAPSFVRKYMDGRGAVTAALDAFDSEVKSGAFPGKDDHENGEQDKELAGAARL